MQRPTPNVTANVTTHVGRALLDEAEAAARPALAAEARRVVHERVLALPKRALERALKAMDTPALIELLEDLYEREHRDWCRACREPDPSGKRLVGWFRAPAREIYSLVRDEYAARAIGYSEGFMLELRAALQAGDVAAFRRLSREFTEAPVPVQRWMWAWFRPDEPEFDGLGESRDFEPESLLDRALALRHTERQRLVG